MPSAWGTPAREAALTRAAERKRESYAKRKTEQRCTDCGKRLDVDRVRCAECLESVNDSIRQRKSDEAYDPGGSRIDADARSTFSHQVERACSDAYRVERYSRPAAAWEVVVYAFPEACAREHAERIAASYRASGIETYARVRVTDSKGREL